MTELIAESRSTAGEWGLGSAAFLFCSLRLFSLGCRWGRGVVRCWLLPLVLFLSSFCLVLVLPIFIAVCIPLMPMYSDSIIFFSLFIYYYFFFTSVAFNDIVYGVCHLRMSMHTTLMSFVCQMFVFVLCLGVGLVLTVVM